MFVLKQLYGRDHETALVEYLDRRPALCEHLDFESVPDQLTLWGSWPTRFSAALRETIEPAARTILITPQNAGVTGRRDPERNSHHRAEDTDESTPDDLTVLQ
ncbi:hypothetical protein [Halomarina pelagica]|uniref:hypothetical protein n=1 Tax=Halomarina pelagica TaxID=2961599 RepID=UPI0020C1FF61|nr:hypothetical protein [Halomarina sp. BND7]